jgi:hypothetical protein
MHMHAHTHARTRTRTRSRTRTHAHAHAHTHAHGHPPLTCYSIRPPPSKPHSSPTVHIPCCPRRSHRRRSPPGTRRRSSPWSRRTTRTHCSTAQGLSSPCHHPQVHTPSGPHCPASASQSTHPCQCETVRGQVDCPLNSESPGRQWAHSGPQAAESGHRGFGAFVAHETTKQKQKLGSSPGLTPPPPPKPCVHSESVLCTSVVGSSAS